MAFRNKSFFHNFVQSIDLKIKWQNYWRFFIQRFSISYMLHGPRRRVVLFIYSISRRCTQIALYTDISAVLLSRRMYILFYSACRNSSAVQRGSWGYSRSARRKSSIDQGGTSVGRDFSPRESGRRRFSSWMHGDEWARWGSLSRDGNPRGIWGRGRNARIECVCALCVHAVLRCARLETRTGYIYGLRLPGRWRHARGICRRGRQRETAAREEIIKINEGELAVPEDSWCRLIRSTRR